MRVLPDSARSLDQSIPIAGARPDIRPADARPLCRRDGLRASEPGSEKSRADRPAAEYIFRLLMIIQDVCIKQASHSLETPGMPGEAKAFFSYSRQDSEFALRLAKDLRERGAAIWIDQLDIEPGTHWDESVEKAVAACSIFLVLLSPHSTESENVMDEVAYALDEKKAIVPVMFCDCKVPLRLRRMQYVDVRASYETGVQEILKSLHVAQRTTDIQSAAQRVQAEQAARDKAQADAAAQAQLAQQQAQQQEQARVLQEQAQAVRMAQLERERQFAVAQQQPPPLSALMSAMPQKNRKPLWIVLGVVGAFLLIGGIISAINDSDAKTRERGYFPPAQDTGVEPAAVPSAPGPVVQQAEPPSVEPQTAAAGALNRADGAVAKLAPGERLELGVRFSVEPT